MPPTRMLALRLPTMAAAGLAAQSFLRRGMTSLILPHSIDPMTGLYTTGPFLSRTPLRSPAFGICSATHAIKGDVEGLTKGGDKDTIENVKHIIEMAERASLRREVLHTDFLTPLVLKESMLVVGKLINVKAIAQGGYPEAERCRLSVGHPEVLATDPDIVSAISISGNFSFEPCSHGDFLGAILGTGISRNKLGDIVLQVFGRSNCSLL